jgi:hypothetical protein
MAGTEFQKNVWRQMQKIALGKAKSYAKSRRRLAVPRPFAPGAARAVRIRFRFWFRAIAFWPRTKNSAASPAVWTGSAACSRVKELNSALKSFCEKIHSNAPIIHFKPDSIRSHHCSVDRRRNAECF